jgi:deoxyribodipyrimidine photo-lyase
VNNVVTVPADRLRVLVDEPLTSRGRYILYWMTAYRRTRHNDALDRAIELAKDTGLPIVVMEGLRAGYEWASDRHHKFVLDGMRANQASFAGGPILYYPYVEPKPGAGAGMLRAMAKDAAAVIGDDWPGFFHPHMLPAAAKQLKKAGVRFEVVDACGLVPFRAAQRTFGRAVDFRRYIQKNVGAFVMHRPMAQPTRAKVEGGAEISDEVTSKWPSADDAMLAGDRLDELPIDHDVGVVPIEGGQDAARRRWREFFERDLEAYAEGRNHPDDDRASRLSPYLHFGHIGIHEIFGDIVEGAKWSPDQLGKANASRTGFWGLSEGAEAFIDELITWRELTHHTAHRVAGYRDFESLPDWARATMDDHREDARDVYGLEALENAETDDPIWNAAQRELVRDGRMHNYLRMLWGKKIYAWSPTPERALEIMVHLNNKYALDGRDPNSYGGIFWVLGRYDRPWGPERPIFGKLRYMTSDSTQKKLRMKKYLAGERGFDF